MKRSSMAKATEGTIVWRWENYTKVEYVVAMHNYAANQNGSGYTLLVRLEPMAETRAWDSSTNSPYTTWDGCSLRKWLNEEYPDLLEPAEKALAAKITLPNENTSDCYFVLNTGEVLDKEGLEVLPGNVIKLLREKNGARYSWGRNSTNGGEYVNGAGEKSECRRGYYWYESRTTGLQYSSTECYEAKYVQPCFAVKADTTAILEDGMLETAVPPEIESDWFGSEVLLTKRGAFAVPYRVKNASREPVTVVTRLDGEYLGWGSPGYGELCWATVDKKHFDALQEAQDHVLTVIASSIGMVNEQSVKFRKSTNLGYVLYMGKITGTDDGESYYWSERNLLHNSHDPDAPIVLDPELTLEKNDFGSLSFTLPADNPCHSLIGPKKTVVSVEEDGTEIFCGYVKELTPGFDLSIEVYCEGELGYLQDRDVTVEEKAYTAEELAKLAMETPEDFKKEGKTFLPGTITVERPESEKDKKFSKDIQSAWDVLNGGLVGNYGGYLRLRKEIKMEGGKRIYTRYLDYMREIPDRTGQTIEFGVNMLDLSYYLKVNTIVNSVKVLGYATSGFWIFSSTKALEVEERNEESIAAYGLVQRTMTVDGTSSNEASLRKVAKEKLAEYKSGLSSGITIEAADLAGTGVNVDRLEFLKNTHVVSKPHGLDDWVLCTKLTIPLDAPDEKSFTFGDSTDALSTMQANNYGTAGKAWNAIQTTIRYVKSGG